MRVLVAEDDPGLRSVLERGLHEQGYVVDAVADGTAALSYLRSYTYEVVVLDWRMPSTTGVEVVRAMRARGDRTPVLMLTARDATEDRVEGLNEGADDYLVKPFTFAELVARLSALQRRPPLTLSPILECGDLSFDPATRMARARMFAGDVGVPEDPATGSAALGLGVWLVGSGLLTGDGTAAYTVEQGVQMGRRSVLRCSVDAVGGTAVAVRVAGDVVPVAEGTITV